MILLIIANPAIKFHSYIAPSLLGYKDRLLLSCLATLLLRYNAP